MTKLSVVVAIYNVEKYVKKCVESLINQSSNNYEIILVDDGSTDSSGKIIDSYLNYENIRIIHQKNKGVSVARNTGIENCNGEWLTFVDGDDYVEKDFINKILKSIDEFDTDMLVFNYNAFFDENNKIKCRTVPFDQDQYISDDKDLFQKRMISQYYKGGDKNTVVSSGTTWCKVIRNNIINNNKIRFKPGLLKAQDTVFWLNATEHVNRIYYLNENLYNYRLSAGSISSGKKYIKNSKEEFNNLINEYEKFIDNYKKDDSFIDAFNLRCIQVLMWNIDHNFFNKKNNEDFNKKIKLFRDFIQVKEYKNAINSVSLDYLPKRLQVMMYFVKRKRLKLYYFVYIIYNFLSDIKNSRK